MSRKVSDFSPKKLSRGKIGADFFQDVSSTTKAEHWVEATLQADHVLALWRAPLCMKCFRLGEAAQPFLGLTQGPGPRTGSVQLLHNW